MAAHSLGSDGISTIFSFSISARDDSYWLATNGKEAVVALHDKGDFFGEGCLTGQLAALSLVLREVTCSAELRFAAQCGWADHLIVLSSGFIAMETTESTGSTGNECSDEE